MAVICDEGCPIGKRSYSSQGLCCIFIPCFSATQEGDVASAKTECSGIYDGFLQAPRPFSQGRWLMRKVRVVTIARKPAYGFTYLVKVVDVSLLEMDGTSGLS